jgi:hypothetical protein
MRYNAFFGELPINAFKPIGGKMTLHGGGNPISAVTNAISDVGDSISDAVIDPIKDNWVDIRDTAEAAAVVAGNYYLPGSSLLTSQLVTEGAQEQLNSDVGKLANLAAGASGGYQGNLSNYGKIGEAAGLTSAGSGASPELLGEASGQWATSPSIAAGAAGAASGAGGSSLSGMLPYMAGGQAVTGLLQANAAKEAADIQSAAAKDATALQGQMFNTINEQQAPYRTAGYGALNDIGELGSGQYTTYDAAGKPTGVAEGSGYLTHQFDATDLQKGLAPNYDFMLQQGQMANQRAANMGGGALGGNALQGLNKYTQDYAGNAYQNAFTNYQNQRNNIYNTLAGIAGIGQTGQNATNAAATNATNAASQLGIGSAAAQAAGQVGSTNALSNTVGNIGNTYMLSQLLNQGGRVG